MLSTSVGTTEENARSLAALPRLDETGDLNGGERFAQSATQLHQLLGKGIELGVLGAGGFLGLLGLGQQLGVECVGEGRAQLFAQRLLGSGGLGALAAEGFAKGGEGLHDVLPTATRALSSSGSNWRVIG